MLVGGREEVGAGAVGRCCVLVWCLAGGCVVAWIGGGCGPFGRKVDFYKIRWKTITCPGPVWLYGVKCQIMGIFVCEWCEKPAAGFEICRKSILRAERHLLVESEVVLGAPGQVLGEVGGVEQKYPSPFTDIKAGVRAGCEM